MDFTIKIIQFLMSLSLLIVLHELGHFIPARLFKTRVEKFYLFFDAGFSLFKIKRGDTEYGIGWLPLGGYVKISGMIDESMDTEQMKSEPKPWEFRSKPAWQRLIIMLGGVTVNVLLAFFIYAMMLFAWGKAFIPNENLTYGVFADSLALDEGIMHGDKIVSVGDITPETLNKVNQEILFGGERDLTIDRDGSIVQLTLSDDIDQKMLASGAETLFYERYPAQIDSVMSDSNAEKAGLKKGDIVIGAAGQALGSFQELVSVLGKNTESKIDIEVLRNDLPQQFEVEVSAEGKLGFHNASPLSFFEVERQSYGFFESFPAGVSEGTNILVSYVKSLKLLFSSEGIKKVGGFGTIANLFDNTWDWQRFWGMTAFLSIILAVMNMLPIPALDGGHVMFLMYEIITGREPPQKFMEYAQIVGIVLLLSLLLYANGMDIYRSFVE